MPKTYWFAYGLTFRSDIPLEEFQRVDGHDFDVDIVVHPPSDRSGWRLAEDVGQDTLLDFPLMGAFILRGVDLIEIYPEREFSLEVLNLVIHGPMAATLLHKRGRLVMHAGALMVDNRAILIAGDKGAGKSTTIASLVERGVPLVCDDVVGIDMDEPRSPIVIPAFPQIKLCDDAAQRIFIPGATIQPKPAEEFEKTILRLDQGFHGGPLEPDTVFLLSRNDVLELTDLSAHEGFQALMRHSYMPMRSGYVWKTEERALHFRQCVALSQRLRVVRLGVPKDLARIPDLLDLILEAARRPSFSGMG